MLANKYVTVSKIAGHEGENKLIEKLKNSNFIESIKEEIAIDLRKQAPANFGQAYKIATNLELALKFPNTANKQEIDNMNHKIIEELLEQNSSLIQN